MSLTCAQLCPLRKCDLWTRHDLLLSDSQQKVTCKMWGEKAEMEVNVQITQASNAVENTRVQKRHAES